MRDASQIILYHIFYNSELRCRWNHHLFSYLPPKKTSIERNQRSTQEQSLVLVLIKFGRLGVNKRELKSIFPLSIQNRRPIVHSKMYCSSKHKSSQIVTKSSTNIRTIIHNPRHLLQLDLIAILLKNSFGFAIVFPTSTRKVRWVSKVMHTLAVRPLLPG